MPKAVSMPSLRNTATAASIALIRAIVLPPDSWNHDLLRVGPAALKPGSECSFAPANSASSPAFALQVSSSLDRGFLFIR
jgi:hypothetical protein